MEEERNFARMNGQNEGGPESIDMSHLPPTQIGPPAEDAGPIRDSFGQSQAPVNAADQGHGAGPSRALA